MLKSIVLVTKKSADHQNVEDFDSETENVFSAITSTPIKSKATTHKICLYCFTSILVRSSACFHIV